MTAGSPGGSVLLSGVGDALGLVAAACGALAAAEVLVEVIPDDTPRRPGRGPESTWCTRVRIRTPDEHAARDLANVLQLVPRPNIVDIAGWEGTYPLTETVERPLRVELALTDATPTSLIRLRGAFSFLELLGTVLRTDIPVVLVHLRAQGADGGSVHIQPADHSAAGTLRLELSGLRLPLRPVVLTPPSAPLPDLQGPVS